MTDKKAPNRHLETVMTQAAVTNKGLAARVRAEAARSGLNISPDHTSVKRWLDGGHPHEDTIRCIATALGTKLGRVVTFDEIGFGSTAAGTSIDLAQDAVLFPASPSRATDVLDSLTAADMTDDSAVNSTPWDPTPVPSVITGYLFSAPNWQDTLGVPNGGHDGLAGRIRATVRTLVDLDFRYGGGHSRRLLLAYWRAEIVPALRGARGETASRAIYAAAADAAAMLGWSAYDAGHHGAAQRYYTQGLRLARDAGDALMGAKILSNLSHQANYLGNFNEAVHFARAAQSTMLGLKSRTVSSMALAMEARALASLGDARGSGTALNRAEREFALRVEAEDPEWIAYFDALELAGEAAHCFRELGQAQKTQLFAAQAIDLQLTPARTQSFINIVHAEGALAAGNLDEAVTLATRSVELAGSVQSSRQLRYLTDFCKTLAAGRHLDHPSVRDLAEGLILKDRALAAHLR
ncbi:hypothetical protein [Actinoplanes sp. NBRC 103695]|uniref:hypothetical protein n=1 Tax=Actinoplanes sp. NBRC 103695 TaxID=3032202 RepID=UPI002557C5E8|nr:hypothetical protein [Actinoplanes sp. NBRC 103695]